MEEPGCARLLREAFGHMERPAEGVRRQPRGESGRRRQSHDAEQRGAAGRRYEPPVHNRHGRSLQSERRYSRVRQHAEHGQLEHGQTQRHERAGPGTRRRLLRPERRARQGSDRLEHRYARQRRPSELRRSNQSFGLYGKALIGKVRTSRPSFGQRL